MNSINQIVAPLSVENSYYFNTFSIYLSVFLAIIVIGIFQTKKITSLQRLLHLFHPFSGIMLTDFCTPCVLNPFNKFSPTGASGL